MATITWRGVPLPYIWVCPSVCLSVCKSQCMCVCLYMFACMCMCWRCRCMSTYKQSKHMRMQFCIRMHRFCLRSCYGVPCLQPWKVFSFPCMCMHCTVPVCLVCNPLHAQAVTCPDSLRWRVAWRACRCVCLTRKANALQWWNGLAAGNIKICNCKTAWWCNALAYWASSASRV